MDLAPLGPAGSQEQYDGIFGGNLLRKYAVRLFLAEDRAGCKLPWVEQTPTWPSITFSPGYADTIAELSRDGYGVIKYELSGGGSAEAGPSPPLVLLSSGIFIAPISSSFAFP